MKKAPLKKLKIIILAGGQGTRLWPKSTYETPKQFNTFFDDETLLEKTYRRALTCTNEENIFISINQKHKKIFKSILPNFKTSNLIIELESKDTTSAILYATLHDIFDGDSVLLFLPSDHFVQKENLFAKDVKKAYSLTQKNGKMTLFGVRPTYAADCYGYLKTKKDANDHLFIEKFIEKPNLAKAAKLIKQDANLWNSGMFMFLKSELIPLAKKHAPEHYEKITNYLKLKKQSRQAQDIFSSLTKISFDYSIMEKIKNMNCVKANFVWNDIGSWSSLHQLLDKDKNKNLVLQGDNNPTLEQVKFFSSSNNLVSWEKQNQKIILNGVEDLFIIQAKNYIYIANKKKESEIKKIVEEVVDEKD